MLAPKTKDLLGEAVVPAVAIIFGIAYFIQTVDAPEGTLRWPAATAALTAIFLVLIVHKFMIMPPKGTQAAPPAKPAPHAIIRPILVLAGPLCYLLVLPVLGFTLGNFIFMLCLFRGLGGIRWTRNIIVAVAIAAFLHVTLILFMKLSLPRLILGGTAIL